MSEPAKFVKEDFYVDDGLKSVPSTVHASALIESMLKVVSTFTSSYLTARK